MQVPVYGNNAYKYERETYEPPKKKVVRKVRVRKKKKTVAHGMILFGLAVIAAFGIILTNSMRLEKNTKINELEERLDVLNAQVVSEQFQIDRDMDLNKIEDEAIGRLGMQRPTKAQTVYVDMGNCDYAETAQPAEGKKGFLVSLTDNIVEYFG